MRRRVAVTGIGLVSPHGQDVNLVFDALMQGTSALDSMNMDIGDSIVAGCCDFDPSPWFSLLQLSGVDRFSQFAVAAADMARQNAGVTAFADPERVGVYTGCGMGGAATLEASYALHFQQRRMPPLAVVGIMSNAAAAHIAMRQQITGPVMTYSVACASSSVAIGEAAQAIACGDIDSALAGGTEAMLEPGILRCWHAMKTLAAPDARGPSVTSRPFAKDRGGMVLAEGAAFLVLESMEQALARGARVYAELAGYAVRCDAQHLARPDAGGQIRTLRAALRNAGLSPQQVGYCNAHGTATRVGDVVEATALREVWGALLPGLRVSSTKSMHGHLLGAAGGLEAAITALAIHRRQLPANLSEGQIDPECALPLTGNQGEDASDLMAAISSSFAFGGTNAVLAFKRSQEC